MNRAFLLLGVWSCSCTPRTSKDTSRATNDTSIAESALTSSGLATATDAALGYATATQTLEAITKCFGDAHCDPALAQRIAAIPLLGQKLDKTTIRRPVQGCTDSASALVQSAFCGMMSRFDLDTLRTTIEQAIECVADLGANDPGCTAPRQQAGTWIGSHSCSRVRPAELQDSQRAAQVGAFTPGKPWVVQISRVTTVAWTICLEGIDDRIEGVTMSAAFAGE